MSTTAHPDQRYVYMEFELDSTRVAMIEDKKNEHAWVQSTLVWPVEQ